MNSIFRIESERLLLRPMIQDDLKDFLKYWNDPLYLRYYPWEAPVKDEGLRLFAKLMSWQRETPLVKHQFAVIEKESSQLIGNCGCRIQDEQGHEADIGYELNPQHWSKGYGSEVIAIMIDFGFRVLKVHRIFAEVIAENQGSNRILEKLMIKEAHFREKEYFKGKYWDHFLYAVLAQEHKGTVPEYSISSIS